MIDCDLDVLMKFARKYARLGTAVQSQMDDLLEGEDSMNPNAVKLIKEVLGGMNDELDQLIADYFDDRPILD